MAGTKAMGLCRPIAGRRHAENAVVSLVVGLVVVANDVEAGPIAEMRREMVS